MKKCWVEVISQPSRENQDQLGEDFFRWFFTFLLVRRKRVVFLEKKSIECSLRAWDTRPILDGLLHLSTARTQWCHNLLWKFCLCLQTIKSWRSSNNTRKDQGWASSMVEKCENLTFFSAVIVEAQKRQAYNLIIVKVYDVKRGIAEKFSALIFHFSLFFFSVNVSLF